jgi:hypothetical protein
MKRNFKRLFIGSDSHCGHKVGLTPPQHRTSGLFGKWEKTQADLWDWYMANMNKHKPYDYAILNGDLIDGSSRKTGGVELISPDRLFQAKLAYECFREINAGKYFVVSGTPYHVGEGAEQFERVIVEMLNQKHEAEYHEVLDVNLNGWQITARHDVKGSSVPYGNTTPLKKEALYSLLWAVKMGEKRPDLTIRSHVHLYDHTTFMDSIAIVTPALMGLGDNYGRMRVSKLVDIGFVVVDLPDSREEAIRWFPVMPKVMLKQ